MIVEDILFERESTDLIVANRNDSIRDAAQRMHKHVIGSLLIVDSNYRIVGLISERDISRAVAVFGTYAIDKTVGEIMTKQVITCTPKDDVPGMLRLMNEHHIRHLPVVENGDPVAMLSIREFDFAVRELQQQALTDELTQIANRRFFDQQLKTELSKFRRTYAPMSIAVADIDQFKAINDLHGHEAGDEILKEFSRMMTAQLRSGDIVGRLGGEEFGFVFPNTELSVAKMVCERLLDTIRSSKVAIDGKLVGFTASMGLTEAKLESIKSELIIARADHLMYEAKAMGRDCLVCDALDVPLERRITDKVSD